MRIITGGFCLFVFLFVCFFVCNVLFIIYSYVCPRQYNCFRKLKYSAVIPRVMLIAVADAGVIYKQTTKRVACIGTCLTRAATEINQINVGLYSIRVQNSLVM